MNSWQRFFSHSVGCLLILIIVFFAVQKHFNLMQSCLSILVLISWAIKVLFWKALLIPISSKVFLMYFSSNFRVSLSYIYIFDPSWIIFLYKMKDKSLVSVFYIWTSVFASTICWRSCLFSNVCFGTFVKNQVAEATWAYVWIFCSISLIYMSVFCVSSMLFCY
jgi:hypothetical protein